MTGPASSILAAGDDVVIKVIFGIVVFVLWGIGALASAVNKQKDQARRQQVREQLEVGQRARALEEMPRRTAPGRRMPPPPPAAPAFLDGPAPMRVLTPPARRPPPPPLPVPRPAARRSKKFKPPRVVPAAPVVPVDVPLPAVPVRAEGQSASHAARPVPTVAEAFARRLTPATLRSQIILAELLQPPLALREGGRHL